MTTVYIKCMSQVPTDTIVVVLVKLLHEVPMHTSNMSSSSFLFVCTSRLGGSSLWPLNGLTVTVIDSSDSLGAGSAEKQR